ncbi:four helix bundle protein [Yersinia intermedia]|nr:four helix bundle protein [Yersinia intermedia]
MKSTFKHPKIYADLLTLYRIYWQIHKHLPKPFRFTTGECVLSELTGCVRYVVLANAIDKRSDIGRGQGARYLHDARASLSVIRGLLTIGWGMSFISHGALMQLTELLDGIEKQATRWQQWFEGKPANLSTSDS